MSNNGSSKGAPTSNVFYTFGFLLLYIHLILNIWSLAQRKEFFHSEMNNYLIKIFGQDSMSISLSLEELVLVGGFVVFTILGIILERMRLIMLSRKAEVAWKYRNRIKQFYAVIAIIIALWVTVQGFIVQKSFDWVWLVASLLIILYSVFLWFYPRLKKAK